MTCGAVLGHHTSKAACSVVRACRMILAVAVVVE